ncbi:MAG: hypothetical protein ACI4D4_02540 [Lachnospira sp.]
MEWFNKLERKYSKYAINNLMTYIIILYAVGFVIELFANGVYDAYLSLDFAMIMKGQVWRLVTFIIQPPSNSIIFVFFSLYFYYMIGQVLESIWGAFRFNVYFFTGVLLNIIAAFIIYLLFGISFNMSTHYINLALFMAFAIEQPDLQVLLFFVIPIKIKWMAILDAIIFAITIICGFAVPTLAVSGMDVAWTVWGSLYSAGLLSPSGMGCYANAIAALVSMLNFIVFMIIFKKGRTKNSAQRNFNKAMKTAKKAQQNRENGKRPSFNETFYNANSEKTDWNTANQPYSRINPGRAKHKCAVCGRTELDDENLVFRFCSKCEGSYEYCNEHLYTHIHVGKQ